MTQIFISFSESDGDCADNLREHLEAHGYRVWQDILNHDTNSVSYPRVIENGIRGSEAIVLLWSTNAAQSEWVERHILFAQRLKKLVLPISIDETDLPITLINVQHITTAPTCTDIAKELLQHLPPANSNDLLLALLTHDYIRERKKGIEHASELLSRGEHREEILALLEDIAHKDLMQSIREMAQAVINAHRRQEISPVQPQESRHIFGVKCPNGHISYFDKRRVCPARSMVKRSAVQRAGAELDELYLKCTECVAEMAVRVDCEGYK